jgi:hypothetical protein
MRLCVNPAGTWPCFLGEFCGFVSGSCVRPTAGYTACSSSGAIVTTETQTLADSSTASSPTSSKLTTTRTEGMSAGSSTTVTPSSSIGAAIQGKSNGQWINLGAAIALGALGL